MIRQERPRRRHRHASEPISHAFPCSAGRLLAAFASLLLAPGSGAGQDYYPGFEVAAQADVVHLTGNVIGRLGDEACVFDADLLVAEAERVLRRNGIDVAILEPPAVFDGVTLDVSAMVLPVLDTDACAVLTRAQLVIGDDAAVMLAAEHFSLLTWTTTGLLRRVLRSVDRDVSAIAEEMEKHRTAAGR